MRLIKILLHFFLLIASVFLYAEEEDEALKEQSVVILSSAETHNGNYFAMGSSVEISGTVNGDVYALAEQVIIDGVVNGDVLACAGSIDISGEVSGNCRLLGGQVLLSGLVGNNVTAVSGNLQLLPSATINGSLVATAANVDLAASIHSDATIVASDLRLSSRIGKGLRAYVGHMRITSRAVIDGNVDYRSATPAWIQTGATISGTVTRHPSFVNELVEGTWIHRLLVGSKILAILMNFLYTFVVGILLVKVFPKNLESAIHGLSHHPLKSLSYGIMLLILWPLASLILLMTILGIPFALALIAANIIGFYTAKIYTIFWASNWIFGKLGLKHNRLPILFFGTVVYFGLTAIPIFGTILAFASMLLGLGAGVLAQSKRHFLMLRR